MEAHGVGEAALEEVVVPNRQLLHDVRQAGPLRRGQVRHSWGDSLVI